MFNSFEQDFTSHIETSRKTLKNLEGLTIKEKSAAITSVTKELFEAEKSLKQMEVEVKTMPQASRAPTQAQIRKRRDELELTKKMLRKEEADIKATKNKETLMGGNTGAVKQRLHHSNDMIIDQNQRLEESQRTAYETERLAIDTMGTLREQRDIINRASSGVKATNENLSKSNRLITGMSRRAMTNKLIMVVIIIMLIIAILLVIYIKTS